MQSGFELDSPSFYLPIAGGRIVGFIPFPRVLKLCKMQSGFELDSPSFYLPIAGGRIVGFIPFPRVLKLCKMQSGFELDSPCTFTTTITITPRATQRNGYRRCFPKIQRRQSSGGRRFNPDYRRVTIQEYLTLVPGYGKRNQNRRPPWIQ